MSEVSMRGQDIAIIGLACQFPESRNAEEFWANIANERELIRFFTDEELAASGVPYGTIYATNYVAAAGILSDIDQFDADFFGYSSKEAELIDPQQRIFLQCAWKALEAAGYVSDNYGGRIGIFGGADSSSYIPPALAAELIEKFGYLYVKAGNLVDFLTSRVAYKLNLTGPSVTVQTACSTSLTAIHMACQSVLNGECDIALAGGVSLQIPQTIGYFYQDNGVMSPDGHCRSFDREAKGFVPGAGVGLIVVKRLADAIKDRDSIHAVIKGSAINNDGAMRPGFSAPSVEGQAATLIEAFSVADVTPNTVAYIEAHGTATQLGDSVEIAAFTNAFRALGAEGNGFCAVGSVKSNIGHAGSAAGVAALIKSVYTLKHHLIPATLHFERPNPMIDFANSPFYVNNKTIPWPEADHPRRAGVASVGFGGTNVHVVLEEAPPSQPHPSLRKPFFSNVAKAG